MGYIIGGWDGLLPYGKKSTGAPPRAGCSRPSNTAIPDIPLAEQVLKALEQPEETKDPKKRRICR
ncbi:MAG: hypothetical protein ACLU8D_09185 [Enterocloster sp.]